MTPDSGVNGYKPKNCEPNNTEETRRKSDHQRYSSRLKMEMLFAYNAPGKGAKLATIRAEKKLETREPAQARSDSAQ
jgi:hypothetical protein